MIHGNAIFEKSRNLFRTVLRNSKKIAEIIHLQDYWVLELCPSYGVLKEQKKAAFRKVDLFQSTCEGWEAYSAGSLRES
jgi:hypothetical protein